MGVTWWCAQVTAGSVVVTWHVLQDSGDTISGNFEKLAKAAAGGTITIGTFKQLSYSTQQVSAQQPTSVPTGAKKVRGLGDPPQGFRGQNRFPGYYYSTIIIPSKTGCTQRHSVFCSGESHTPFRLFLTH